MKPADQECPICPEGNLNLKWRHDKTQRSAGVGYEEALRVGVFRCSQCGHVKEDGYDPAAPGE